MWKNVKFTIAHVRKCELTTTSVRVADSNEMNWTSAGFNVNRRNVNRGPTGKRFIGPILGNIIGTLLGAIIGLISIQYRKSYDIQYMPINGLVLATNAQQVCFLCSNNTYWFSKTISWNIEVYKHSCETYEMNWTSAGFNTLALP